VEHTLVRSHPFRELVLPHLDAAYNLARWLIQVGQGRLNKQIAGEMGITETTVKVHRSNMMRKIKAASLVELCRMVDKLKLLPDNPDELS
jgi:DNA-binding NarL/FixJ family response regulator